MTTLDHYDPHNNGIEITDWNLPIYRVFNIKYLKDLIANTRNCLVHPSMWDDPYENFFLRSNCVTASGERVSLDSVAADWYGQCWTTNRESDALWRIYSHNKDGARVATTIKKLFDNFYDRRDDYARLKYFIGTVKYKTRGDIETFWGNSSFEEVAFGGMPHGFANTLCVKRTEFDHEKEVRLLFQDASLAKIGKGGLAFFAFDHAPILDEVALDPRLTDQQFVAAKTDLENSGCKVQIIRSDLYHITPVTIRL